MFNPRLVEVAMANIDRMEKPALVPGGPEGLTPPPPEGGGMPPEMAGGMPPEMAGGMPPEMAGGMPPDAGAAPPGGAPPGGAPPGGGDPVLERLASLEGKMDQFTGVLNGFLMGQQSAGGSKSGGGSGGQNQEMLGLLQQMAQAMGVTPAPAAGAAPAGGALGMGMPGQPTPPGGPLAPPMPDPGMTVSASDRNSDSAADRIGKIMSNFRR